MPQKILVTSALPYANGPLHFGHIAGAYLPADCYVRFERLMKNDVVFICGSDEYGVAITLSADLAGRTPKEHVDIFHKINSDFFKQLDISFDHYSRTTWEGHAETVCQYFKDLLANGYIEPRITDQLYSAADQKFLADRYVVGECPRCGCENARGDECPRCGASYEATELKNPRSKLTQAPLTLRATEHWFLLLDKFKEPLKEWIESKAWKANVANFSKDFIEHMHARAITRDSDWGIPLPLPGQEGKVLYVWFDAPIGYISAAKEWAQRIGAPERWKEYWCDSNTKYVQFVGKDNIPFHAAIFPAMTMGQNVPYKLVDELPANEFYNLEGRQFSKSEGWYIDLEDFFKHYTTDQIRYAIASNAPETSDSEFTWKDFQARCNGELLGKYGNLVNRVLVFLHAQCEGKTPASAALEPMDEQFLQHMQQLAEQSAESFGQFKVRRASQVFMELAQAGNVYFDAKQPWKDAKQEETRGRMRTTLACCLECLKVLALISRPVIPATAEQVWQMLGFHDTLEERGWRAILQERVPTGQSLPTPHILFQKIEDEQIEREIQRLKQLAASKNVPAPATAPLKPEVTIDDVRKLDLRVGIIRSAEAVPKSKKLLRLQVDIGSATRPIVAGIGEAYKPEDLIGRSVIVVANLKPALLMGNQSEGMLLAAQDGGVLELISVAQCKPGSEIN